MSNSKKILIILFILLFIAIGVFLVYNFLFKKTPPEKIPSEEVSYHYEENVPPAEKRIKTISKEPVVSPIIGNDNKIKYYSAINGNLWECDINGNNFKLVSSKNRKGLIKVLWSPNKTESILIFSINDKIKKYFYNYTTDRLKELSSNIKWIAFSPSGNKIAYQYIDEKSNNISIANPDGNNWQNILPTRIKDLIVEWPSSDKISIRTKPSGLAQSVLYTISVTDSSITKILTDIYGLSILWSPTGDKFIYSSTNNSGKNLTLNLRDKNGNISDLNIATLPEKCVWSVDDKTLYCAVPKILPNRAVLPDDYYKGLVSTSDEIWKINTQTKEKTLIIDTDYDVFSPLLSPYEKYLFFINKKNGYLYRLTL